MYIIAISHFFESRTAIQLIFVMLHARKTLCNVTKAHGACMHACMHEVDGIDHQAFLSARLRWVSAMCDGFMRRLENWLRGQWW